MLEDHLELLSRIFLLLPGKVREPLFESCCVTTSAHLAKFCWLRFRLFSFGFFLQFLSVEDRGLCITAAVDQRLQGTLLGAAVVAAVWLSGGLFIEVLRVRRNLLYETR